SLGGGTQCRGRVAARQCQELFRPQAKTIGLLEGRQRRRALDKLGRGGELEAAPVSEISGKLVEAFAFGKTREIVADRDKPGVVGRCRVEPNETVLRVELFHLGISLRGILPRGFTLAMEEDGAVPSVLGVEVDLAGEQRRTHDIRRTELDTAVDS